MKKRYFTNSEMVMYKDCMRRWYIKQYLSLGRVHERVSETTEVGNGVHFAAQHYYNSGGQADIEALCVEYYARAVARQEELLKDEDISDGSRATVEENIAALRRAEGFAIKMVEGYVEWLAEEGADSYLKFLSAEEEVAVPFPAVGLPKEGVEDVHLLAKLDVRFEDERSGARVFMDHKTVQNFADREKWAHLDPQFYFYSMIDYLRLNADIVGEEQEWTDGGIINMLRKVKRTGNAKPPFYKRLEVRHSRIELKNFYLRIAGEITRIQQTEMALDSGVDHHIVCPPNPSRDCDWKCEFMQLCAMMDDGSDVEGYIETALVVRNPLERYDTV